MIEVKKTKSNILVYKVLSIKLPSQLQATVKMLDYTGYTTANKTERSKTGISRLLIAKFEF